MLSELTARVKYDIDSYIYFVIEVWISVLLATWALLFFSDNNDILDHSSREVGIQLR